MAPAGFSEMRVLLNETTRRHVPKDNNLQIQNVLEALVKECRNSAKWNILYWTVECFSKDVLFVYPKLDLLKWNKNTK
jgi:hypothetical protein